MRHRLLEKPIPPLVAFFAIALIGGVATAIIVCTVDTAEFLASQAYDVDAL
jgi:hypothetical protein